MEMFLLGAVGMGTLVAAVFLLKLWRRSRDRLFLLFAIAFGVLAVQRWLQAAEANPNEGSPEVYTVRLVAFLIIMIAIVDKNLRRA